MLLSTTPGSRGLGNGRRRDLHTSLSLHFKSLHAQTMARFSTLLPCHFDIKFINVACTLSQCTHGVSIGIGGRRQRVHIAGQRVQL
jgi:hypothetical protein